MKYKVMSKLSKVNDSHSSQETFFLYNPSGIKTIRFLHPTLSAAETTSGFDDKLQFADPLETRAWSAVNKSWPWFTWAIVVPYGFGHSIPVQFLVLAFQQFSVSSEVIVSHHADLKIHAQNDAKIVVLVKTQRVLAVLARYHLTPLIDTF